MRGAGIAQMVFMETTATTNSTELDWGVTGSQEVWKGVTWVWQIISQGQ